MRNKEIDKNNNFKICQLIIKIILVEDSGEMLFLRGTCIYAM